MATLENVDAHGHRYWLRSPDGHIQEIRSKGVATLAIGSYEITSVEPSPKPVPNIPPPTQVTIVNVGQETIHFASVVDTFELKEGQGRPLKAATYTISSDHIGPK